MSDTIDDGGPAFPGKEMWRNQFGDASTMFAPGMTLRDWFAGQALMGMFAHPIKGQTPAECAHDAYLQADAMLAARKAGKDGEK